MYLLHVPLQTVRSSGVEHQLQGLGKGGGPREEKEAGWGLGTAVLHFSELQHQILSSEVGFHSQPSCLLRTWQFICPSVFLLMRYRENTHAPWYRSFTAKGKSTCSSVHPHTNTSCKEAYRKKKIMCIQSRLIDWNHMCRNCVSGDLTWSLPSYCSSLSQLRAAIVCRQEEVWRNSETLWTPAHSTLLEPDTPRQLFQSQGTWPALV